jgi:hypothetical protein
MVPVVVKARNERRPSPCLLVSGRARGSCGRECGRERGLNGGCGRRYGLKLSAEACESSRRTELRKGRERTYHRLVRRQLRSLRAEEMRRGSTRCGRGGSARARWMRGGEELLLCALPFCASILCGAAGERTGSWKRRRKMIARWRCCCRC